MEIILDILMGIDIIITCFTAFIDEDERIVKNHKKIIVTYLKSTFLLDLFSILPFWLLDNGQKTGILKLTSLPKIHRLLKTCKLFRVNKMAGKHNSYKVTKFFNDKIKLSHNIQRLFVFIIVFLLLNHLCACFWLLMAKLQDLNPDTWVVRLGYADISNFDLYLICFYWTLTTVTTVGYGDVTAGTTIERIYNLIIMGFGVILYSFAIGSLSSIVDSMDQKKAEMNQKLEILYNIKKDFNLGQDIYDKVRKVIKYDLSRNHKDKMEFLQELPNKMRIELSQIMHDKALQDLYFFRDQPNDFFAYVAPLMKPVKYSQNDYIFQIEDVVEESKLLLI